MSSFDKNVQAFFALVRAGLWEQEFQLASLGQIDFNEVYRLAEEQSVLGLVAAGVEHVKDTTIPKDILLQFAGNALQLEQRNMAMNEYIAILINKLRGSGVYTILVKGQGIAQCYERSLWRASGDVDLLLSNDNYFKATQFLTPLASKVDEEDIERKHLALTLDPWVVELHGSLKTNLWKSLDHLLQDVQNDIFYNGNVRSWVDGNTQVFLPGADDDVVFVFSHILQHFFVEGIGLRQICDWCRLLYTYREKIDGKKLETRLKSARLMSEWKVFSALAVEYLGMPEDAMPFYKSSTCLEKKAKRVLRLILDTGTFGHSRDMSYKQRDSFFVRLTKSFARRNKDAFKQILVFPIDGLRMWWKMVVLGVGVAVKGK